ncbi:MAG TPA: hypothetical protein VFW93_15020 [Aquabacterium sp.]|uniref:hypothetical protein n=1 Tax=Aquabacterium sp. TaxID=1872578 RepID=UPI002E2F25AC|nr:hypothetical protein [Aquabacterium sp.]HEX5357522.1 hypothetical protein [Aquabacterium sp.]
MLRSLVLILLIVNAAFFAWSKGWLNQVVGVQPDAQHEPQRMGQQIHADKIVVLAAGAGKADKSTHKNAATLPDVASSASSASTGSGAASAATGASQAAAASTQALATSAGAQAQATPPAASESKDTKCVEAGPFNASEYASLEANLKPILPPGSWGSRTVAIQGLWLVYMGPYADADMLERKQAELRRIKGLSFEEVRTPANLALGISLGRFTRQEDADTGLNAMRNRGIRTARIVNVRPPMEVQVLRVPRASVGMQVTLASMKLPQGKGFSACRP